MEANNILSTQFEKYQFQLATALLILGGWILQTYVFIGILLVVIGYILEMRVFTSTNQSINANKEELTQLVNEASQLKNDLTTIMNKPSLDKILRMGSFRS